MTHHTDAELLRDIEEHMRKMWDARLLPAVCWPTELAQRLTQAVQRHVLESAAVKREKMQLRLAGSVRKPPEVAPVQLPEPDAWRYTDARGHFRYRGTRPGFAVEYPRLKPEPLYTEQQVRELLAAHGIGKDKA